MPAPSSILVYDAKPDGHRRNYVDTIATLIGGRGCIAPLARSVGSLIAARGLVLTTFETAPMPFTMLLTIRALLGRRSSAIFLRAHLTPQGRPLIRRLKRAAQALLARLPQVQLLSITPVPDRDGGSSAFRTIADPEFWDLDPAKRDAAPTELSSAVMAHAAGRRVLLFAGYVEASRGIEFLDRIFCDAPGFGREWVAVVAGTVLPDGQDAAARLRASGALVEDRFLDQAELLSLFRVASAVWCCFPPERDMSSGVFGRSLQFGIAPIVRVGSILDNLGGDRPNAIRLEYGNVEMARRALAGLDDAPASVVDTDAMRRHVGALLEAHLLPG